MRDAPNTVAIQTAPLIQSVLHEANLCAAALVTENLSPMGRLRANALVAALKELER